MSTDWILPTLLAAALLSAPGLLLLRAGGARIAVSLGAAPPVTVLLTVLAGAALKLVGLPWSPVTATGSLVLAVLVVLLVRALLRRRRASTAADGAGERERRPLRARVLDGLPVLVAAVTGLATAAGARAGMGTIDTLNGSYDSFFHLAAIEFVREDGDAFLLTALQGIYHEPTFYPAAWDVLTALLPFGPVTSANAMALAMLALLPAALAAMTGLLLGPATPPLERRVLTAASALCAPLFLSLPVITLVMGLWPFVLGSLCLPVALGALWRIAAVLPAPGRLRAELPQAAGTLLLGTVLLAGAVLAHPSNVFSLGAAVLAALLARAVVDVLGTAHRRRGVRLLVALAALAVLYAAGSGVLLASMDLTTTSPWGWPALLVSVLIDRPRLTVLPVQPWPVLVPWLLAALGLLAGLRSRRTEPAAVALAASATALLGVVLALSILTNVPSPLARAWVNPWYGARERIAPLLLCGVTLLAMLGLRALLRRDRGGEGRRWRTPVAAALLGATAVGAVAVPDRLPFVGSLAYTAYGVQLAPYVTPRERAFIERSAAELPGGAVVIGNPRDGEALYWSLGGVETVFPTLAEPQTLDSRRAARYLDEAATNPDVCESWKKVGADHLYVDTSAESGEAIAPGPSELWEGLQEIPQDRLVLVDRDGPYALYRIEPLC
ncbi:hypothetical protein GCM10009592_29610 [Brachybacterium rhamnosum]|uniref:DUF6541 family protein n=1 Tax=Brachybacterium rhamnosum TaxID=173361 RepID=A0ABW4Q2A0_9MICO